MSRHPIQEYLQLLASLLLHNAMGQCGKRRRREEGVKAMNIEEFPVSPSVPNSGEISCHWLSASTSLHNLDPCFPPYIHLTSTNAVSNFPTTTLTGRAGITMPGNSSSRRWLNHSKSLNRRIELNSPYGKPGRLVLVSTCSSPRIPQDFPTNRYL